MGVSSPVRTRTPTYYLDFSLSPGSRHFQPVPSGWTTFLYTLEGRVRCGGGESVDSHHTVLFTSQGDGVQLENGDSEEARLVMISGKPLGNIDTM